MVKNWANKTPHGVCLEYFPKMAVDQPRRLRTVQSNGPSNPLESQSGAGCGGAGSVGGGSGGGEGDSGGDEVAVTEGGTGDVSPGREGNSTVGAG
jgi:uncharacterized membrane protein